ncbi:triose-phosphate isomerase [Candidatus Kaiserbacteria bacterium CG10_big_fil_rev_8_21_14_0_10_51_14]|uniref:Triosephosphate isomerase n=1 Tax=Candidatus Kaiserbacteria bacterium CG10_big_fil_rev_8_21_14_0_10_51_14 TaxID=1974610 RepID=A0A2H0UCV9_9BACT|nr:MAG: triose-phosphate isomerase [Candidatus Kaiserbacteria bacterium CG10_big_fil_rev_8_21_14_0_10_51_14]
MKSIVVANWKMHPASWRKAKKLFEATKEAAEYAKNVTLIVAPPALYVRELRAAYKGRRIAFAVQNAHFESEGAFTGEISLAQAKDAGISYAIIGHAERRAMGESNDATRKKVAAALSLGITPILCVGESKRNPDGEYLGIVKEQLRTGLQDVPTSRLLDCLITYEPLWVISPAPSMNPRQMHEMSIFIRKTIVEMHGERGHQVKILYGGSIDESGNAPLMLKGGDVRGLLVGRASLDAEKFATLMNELTNA